MKKLFSFLMLLIGFIGANTMNAQSGQMSEFKADEVDYVYSYSIKPVSSDSIAAACYFEPMGDFYVKGVILLDDPNVYEAYVEQIKEFGYKQTKEEMSESDPKEKYVKDNYYFICDKEKKIIELHYDFMKAQNIGG